MHFNQNIKSFNICQWNCRSAIANKNNLEHLLAQNDIHIALLSETWFKPNKYISFSGYNVIRQDRDDGRGGVAILIKSNLKFTEILGPQLNNIMYTGIRINNINNTEISIISIYIKPQTKISRQTWSNFFKTVKKPFLIGGDFNAHHMAWGCQESNIYGINLLEAMEINNIIYLNNGNFTRLSPYGGLNSAIDLTLTSPCLQHMLNWSILDDTYGSDHLPIIINCDITPRFTPNTIHKKWNIRKANWDEFYLECIKRFNSTSKYTYDEFIHSLNDSLQSSVPVNAIRENKKKEGKSWWNETCSNVVLHRKEKFTQYKNNPNINNLILYKKADAMAKKKLKEEKTKSWRNYCTSLNKNTPIKEIWKKVNSFKNRKQVNKMPHTLEDTWLEEFHCKLTPMYVSNSPPSSQNNDTNIQHFLTQPFCMAEFERVMKSNNNSAPGKDNIHYSVLFKLPQCAKKILLDIYNKIFDGSHPIPKEWKDYIIVPILKFKKPQNIASSYRPIALASCVMKTYERLLKNRLEWWMEKNNKFPKSQFGFRRGFSTQEAVTSLLTEIYTGFTENKSTSALFMDIQGAYDNVIYDILIKKLRLLDIPPKFIQNIYSIYSGRLLYIRTQEGLTQPRSANMGLPQGSILSPILYIIYTFDLETVMDLSTNIIQYADDVCIFTKSKHIDDSNNKIRQNFERTLNWFNNNGLTLSEEKSILCTFTRKRTNLPNSIKMSNNIEIPYKSTVRYLGFTLDKKLLWKDHIHQLIKRTENAINIIRIFSHQKWGADPNISLMFYRSYVRSVLDYGCQFYGAAAETHTKKIEVIQNKCLRLCIGYLQSTPITVIGAESVEPPHSLRRNFLSDKLMLKLIAKNSYLVDIIHKLVVDNYTHNYWKSKKTLPLVNSYSWITQTKENIHSNKLIPYFQLNDNYYKNIPEILIDNDNLNNPMNLKAMFLENLRTIWSHSEQIFTDGSLKDNKTGCAFYHKNKKISKQFRLLNNTSIFSAELWAIWESLLYCLESNKDNFIIFTDSKSSLLAIKNCTFKAPSNYIVSNILNSFDDLKKQNKNVILVWIKSHIGILENEIVDKLAKQATENKTFTQNFYLPHSDLYRKSKMQVKYSWEEQYLASNKGIHFKQMFPNINKKTWFHTETNRHFIKTMSRLRSQHALYPEHMKKIGLKDNDSCECGKFGDLNHYILECPLNERYINELFQDLARLIQFPINMDVLVSSNNLDVYRRLYKFIKHTNMEI